MDLFTFFTTENGNVTLLGLQTMAVVLAAIFAWRAYKQTSQINDLQSQQTQRIHQEQIQLARNQAFIALYEQLKTIRFVNPQIPQGGWEEVAKSANSLELIAVAFYENIVDRDLLYKNYGKLFLKIFKQIHDAEEELTGKHRGRKMLMDNPSTLTLHDEWREQLLREVKSEDNNET